MKGIDLSNYALEDLLSFDDIFLDYFNNFLKNPAFPQAVQYNRFLSIFEEIAPTHDSLVNTDRLPKRGTALSSLDQHATSFSSNEAEQNKIFDWVRKERLPLFFRTNLFREFKLCKLLARPLDEERRDSIASSQDIGGYSRQSPPNSNTLSTDAAEDRLTAGAAAEDGQDENLISPSMYYPQLEKLNKYLFQRPGSRAFSVPAYFPFFTTNKMSIGKSGTSKKGTEKQRPPTVSHESTSNKDSIKSTKLALNLKAVLSGERVELKRQDSVEDLTKLDISAIDKFSKQIRRQKGQLNSSEIKSVKKTKTHLDDPFDAEVINDEEIEDDDDYANPADNNNKSYNDDFDFDDYEEDEDDETQNVTKRADDLISIDDEVIDDLIDNEKVHASINQYKLKFLGSVRGMNEFREFLTETLNGDRFIKFWLDCEFYRDSMQDYDQIENMATRNRLFRDINEKYVFPFSNKVHEKIKENYSEQYGLNHQVFERIQYDILRRLRSYWVPRYILSRLRNKGKNYGTYPLPPLTPEYSRQSTYNTVPSGKMTAYHKARPLDATTVLNGAQKKILYETVKQALHVDKEAGGPFLRFVSINYPDYLALVLFWYDVIDFNESYTNRSDKNSRMQHAWAIYNSYLSPTSRFNVGAPSETTEVIRNTLQELAASSANTDIDVNIFKDVTEYLVTYLESPWLEFVKDDMMKYTEARLAQLEISTKSSDDSGDTRDTPEKFPDPEIEISDHQIYVSRPWVHKLLLGRLNEVTPPPKPKIPLTDEQKAARAKRIKLMEIERRKALKAARKRMKAKQHGATPSFDELMNIPEGNETQDSRSLSQSLNEKPNSRQASTSFRSEKSQFFDKMLTTNKSMMQLLRKFLVDSSQRESLNKFNLYLDAKQYLETAEVSKKQIQATNIQRNYLDPNSKKNILPLNEKLQARLQADMSSENRGQARPRSPFLIACTKEFRPLLEEEYQKFCELQAKELGMTSAEDFAGLSQAELLVLLGDNYNAKDFDFDDEKGEGKQMPSKEDRAEFLKILLEWAMGRYDYRFFAYYAHLTEHGKKDGLPYLDKDLLFCIDTLRLKEINGDEVLKHKCQVMLDVYLDSSVLPPVQVDINHETHQKLIKALAKIMQASHTNADFVPFDDAKALLFKDLLPYWSGFKHQYKQIQPPPTEIPLTRPEKIVKERLDEYMSQKSPPQVDFKLPPISGGPRRRDHYVGRNNEGGHGGHGGGGGYGAGANAPPHQNLQIVFSLATGIKYKDEKSVSLNLIQSQLTNQTVSLPSVTGGAPSTNAFITNAPSAVNGST